MDKPTNRRVEQKIETFMSQIKIDAQIKNILKSQLKEIAELAYIGGQMNQADHDQREFNKIIKDWK